MDSSVSQCTLLYVHWYTGMRTNGWQHFPGERSAGGGGGGHRNRKYSLKHTLTHTCTHICPKALILDQKNKSALHLESPLIVPSHEISALAKTQAQKGKTKTNRTNTQRHAYILPHTGLPNVDLARDLSLSLHLSLSVCLSVERQPGAGDWYLTGLMPWRGRC